MTSTRKLVPVYIILIALCLTLIVPGDTNVTATSSQIVVSENTIYLPLITRNYPPPPTIFGGQVSSFTNTALIQLASDARLSWVRIDAFKWNEIEPIEPVNGNHTYDWSHVPETSLQNIAANNMYAIAVVHMTPDWAQKYAGVSCGPIKQENLADFAVFLQAAVKRYSRPPYRVHYWELGNEPDIDYGLVTPDSGYGCWGKDSDPYYGGGYYAEMLQVVYHAIKAVDPQAKILIGGLLLDCDPNDADCKNPKPAKFLEGILRHGGGNYFDIVSFHGYAQFKDGIPDDENYLSWNERGGVVLGKVNFLNEVLNRFGVNKPLLLTEGGLTCPSWNRTDCDPPGEQFEDIKADYVVWLYTRGLAKNLLGSVWYTFDTVNWRSGSLIGQVANPNPAYDAFKFITSELSNVTYLGQPLESSNPLRSYEFLGLGKHVWVIWSPDGSSHELTLPSGYTHIYNKFGNPMSVSGSVINVNSPIYIELP